MLIGKIKKTVLLFAFNIALINTICFISCYFSKIRTISSNFMFEDIVFLVDSGNVRYDSSSLEYGIRPSFYLKNSVTYSSGDGTISNPIRIN